MKKTIAILLVLVIGMVGVFAQTETINLTASVTPINKLLITIAQYDDITDYASASLEASLADLDVAISSMNPISVGYLSIFSNSRTGFGLSYEATALSSTIAGETRYINYSLGIGSFDVESTNDATGISQDLFTANESTTEWTVYSEMITITPLDFDTAVAGTDYAGSITFTFTAS